MREYLLEERCSSQIFHYFSVLYHFKLNILGVWTVGWTEQDVWGLGLDVDMCT